MPLSRLPHRFAVLALCLALLLAGCTTIVIPPREEALSEQGDPAAETGAEVDAPAATEAEPAAAPAMFAGQPSFLAGLLAERPPGDADPDRAAAKTREGIELFRTSDFERAEAAFREALLADPDHVPALTGLSDLFSYHPQMWNQSLELAERARALAGDDPKVLAHLVWSQQMAHRFDDAKASGARAVEVAPDSFLANAAYADILLSMYETEQARHYAEQAVALNPDNPIGWVVLGAVLETMHDWAGAEEAINKAVALDPDFLLWTIVQSRLDFDLRGDPELAAELAAEVMETMPDHAYVLGLKVDLAIERNDWETAVEACRQLADLNSPTTRYPDGYTCLASVALLQEDSEQAAEHQTRAEEIAWKDRLDVSLVRMRLLNDAEKCQESRALAQKWLDTRPYSISATRMMGVGFLCSDDYEQAIEHLQRAVAKIPWSVADARLLAIAHARNDQKSEANSALEQVRSIAFEDPLYYQGLYEINFILGDLEAAIENAQRWSVFRPLSTDALESIAYAQIYNGDVEAALRSAQAAYDMGSTTSTTFGILGYVNLLYGEMEMAEDFLLKAVERDGDMYLAQYSLTQLYQYSDRCEDSEPHVEWLIGKADEPDEVVQIKAQLQSCFDRRDAYEKALENRLTFDEYRSKASESFTNENMAVKFFNIVERAGQRSLVVWYASEEVPNSDAWKRQEIGAGVVLSTHVARLEDPPDSIIVVSGIDDQRIVMVVIDMQYIGYWHQDQLSDEDFIRTWRREDASGMPADVFDE